MAGAASVAALALAGCGPDDGVLTTSFALLPAANLAVPPAAELGGREMTPLHFESAQGMAVGNVEGRTLRVVVDGLPPIATSLDGPYYNLTLLLGDEPVLPQSSAKWDRLLSLLGAPAPAHAHGDPVRFSLGRITPDPLGHTELSLAESAIPIDYIVGGLVEIFVPRPGNEPKLYRILEGEVGNVTEPGGIEPPDTGGGGHHH
jgi:hypothetical protein